MIGPADEVQHSYLWADEDTQPARGTPLILIGSARPANDLLTSAIRAGAGQPPPDAGPASGSLDELGAADLGGGGVLALMPAGASGQFAALLRQILPKGLAAAVTWDVNAHTRLLLMDSGRTVADVEHLGQLGTEDDTQILVQGLDPELPRSALLAVAERHTGIHFTTMDLSRIKRFTRLAGVNPTRPAVPSMTAALIHCETAALTLGAAGQAFMAAVTAASLQQRTKFASWIVRDAVEHSDLSDTAAAAAGLAALEHGVGAEHAIQGLLAIATEVRRLSELAAAEDPMGVDPATRLAWSRAHAIAALRCLLSAPGVESAAVWSAGEAALAARTHRDEFIHEALAILTDRKL